MTAISLDKFRKRIGLSRLYYIAIILAVGIVVYSTTLCLGNTPMHSPKSTSGLKRVYLLTCISASCKKIWYHGIDVKQYISAYSRAYKSLASSRLFWHVFLPLFGTQTIYDWAMYIYQDFYITFEDLGLGGSGRFFHRWLRARARAFMASVDVMWPPRVAQDAIPYRGRLHTLPQRMGPRHTILGVTPQRQVDYSAPPNTQLRLEALMAEFVSDDPINIIEVRRSFLERGLNALRRRLSIPTDDEGWPLNNRAAFFTHIFAGEIYHAHRDGTSHVVLHSEDCRKVMEAGWGERHPFSTTAWYWKLYFNWYLRARLPVPENLVILYAPRHQGEYNVIRQIIQAAVWHATDGQLHPIEVDTYPVPADPQAAASIG